MAQPYPPQYGPPQPGYGYGYGPQYGPPQPGYGPPPPQQCCPQPQQRSDKSNCWLYALLGLCCGCCLGEMCDGDDDGCCVPCVCCIPC
ncbi:hypothetical protein AB6A40_000079 [Gnathostoma spinigerum]|uniref:Cysteine-rich transmembrane CYSTM domain-containing protein n=1 Tax=Gnathostoma spinigerum TaxID=75299 RepID=A0ABD6E1C6_9BILA